MKAFQYAALMVTTTITSACMTPLKDDDDARYPLSEVVNLELNSRAAAYQDFLHFQDCDELFLEYGYETTPDGVIENGDQRVKKPCEDRVVIPNDGKFPEPALGLALSGGGTRAASYAIGVMKALDEEKYLDEANIISSVSGGSYANYWYFMQRYYQYTNNKNSSNHDLLNRIRSIGRDSRYDNNSATYDCSAYLNPDNRSHTLNDLFVTHAEATVNGSYAFQRHLTKQSDIVNYSESAPVQYLETVGLVSSHVGSLPFYWLTDGVLDLNVFNGSFLTNAYRKGLERTYGLSPNMKFDSFYDYFEHVPQQFHNAARGRPMFWRKNARAVNMNFEDVRSYMAMYNFCAAELQGQPYYLPRQAMPLINATVKPDFSFFKSSKYQDRYSPENQIYTISPLEFGSELEGYRPNRDLFTPISVSKAVAVSGAAADENARQSNWFTDVLLRLTNLNLGYDIRNPRTQDSRFGTAWYWGSKLINGAPLGFFIPEEYKPTIHISDGGGSENLGVFSLIRRGVKRIIVVDAEHDSNYQFDGLRRLQANLEGTYKMKVSCYNYSKGKKDSCPRNAEYLNETAPPFFVMKVYAPWDEDYSKELSEIVYLKLSINSKLVSEECTESLVDYSKTNTDFSNMKYPCSVYNFYNIDRDGRDGQFPHNTTADIWYEAAQYEAYRDLGYHVAKVAFAGMAKDPKYSSWWADAIQKDNLDRKNYVELLRSSDN